MHLSVQFLLSTNFLTLRFSIWTWWISVNNLLLISLLACWASFIGLMLCLASMVATHHELSPCAAGKNQSCTITFVSSNNRLHEAPDDDVPIVWRTISYNAEGWHQINKKLNLAEIRRNLLTVCQIRWSVFDLFHSFFNCHYSRFRSIAEKWFWRKALKYKILKSSSDHSLQVLSYKLPSLTCSVMYELCFQ